jgi:hypothetical protein
VRGGYAQQLVERPWPPGRNEACWRGYGVKYKKVKKCYLAASAHRQGTGESPGMGVGADGQIPVARAAGRDIGAGVVVLDVDSTILTAHSDKDGAAPTCSR